MLFEGSPERVVALRTPRAGLMQTPVSHAWRWCASWFARQRVSRLSSAHHPHLEVNLVRGRKVLDGATVNYSFGGLHELFSEAFERLHVAQREIQSVLVLGLGAGSVVHILRRDCGVRAPITALEIDPVVVELARAQFGLGRWKNLEVVVADAVEWVESSQRRFDLVVVDLFHEAEVPAACRTPRFSHALGAHLAPGGLLVFNVVASRPLTRAEAVRFAAVFEATLGSTRVLEVRGNLVLTWERPRAESLVADDASRR